MGAIARLWHRLLDWLAPEQPAAFTPPRLMVDLPPFNWLADYGPYWEPGSTAFWLEPRKESDLIAWLRKYRPGFVGEFEAAGLSVVVAACGPSRMSINPYQNALMGNYRGASLAMQMQQASLAQMQYQHYADMQMRQQRVQRGGLLDAASGLLFPLR